MGEMGLQVIALTLNLPQLQVLVLSTLPVILGTNDISDFGLIEMP